MTAHDNLNEQQFKVRKVKSVNGRRSTIISAHSNGQKTGYAKVTEGGTQLDMLHVQPGSRGQGIGHQLMDQVTSHFGSNTLRLEAHPFGKGDGPDKDGLQKFYGQHGFEPDGGTNGLMKRNPS